MLVRLAPSTSDILLMKISLLLHLLRVAIKAARPTQYFWYILLKNPSVSTVGSLFHIDIIQVKFKDRCFKIAERITSQAWSV